jgi:hypothetical protein
VPFQRSQLAFTADERRIRIRICGSCSSGGGGGGRNDHWPSVAP